MTTSSELFLAWVAGFFDGEGCICVANHPRSGPALRVNIAQKNRLVLELIQQRLGGKIYARKDGTSQLWYQTKDEIKTFLTAISPYVILRKSEVDIALRFHAEPLEREQVIEDLRAASTERRK